MCFGKTAHNPATHITVTVPSDKCLVCQSGATSRPPRRENRACGGSDSSSNVFCRHFRRIKSCVYCRGQAGPPIGSNKSAQPRFTFGNYQGNVTDALRRSEAELACSEFDIFTTRSPGPASLLERVEREGGKSVDRGDRLADRRGAHLGSMPAARAHRGSDTPEKVHTEGSRAWKRANALRPLAWARKK